MKTHPRSCMFRLRIWHIELVILPILIIIAVYFWTAPMRAERALRTASFNELRALSRREPNNPRVFYYLGTRLSALGQMGPSRAAFARAAAIDTENEEIGLAWGRSAAAFGHEQEAFEAFSNCVRNHPNSAGAHLALALFYYEHFAIRAARDEAHEASRCNPRDAAAWRLAGVAGLQLQDLRQAESALVRAIAVAPSDWRCQLAFAQVLTAQHRPMEALTRYQEAARLAPQEMEVTLQLGQALLADTIDATPEVKRGAAASSATLEAAESVLEKAAVQDPKSASAQYGLGLIAARRQQWDSARSALERAEDLAPNRADIHFELARVYRHRGNIAASVRETTLHHRIKARDEEKLSLGSRARTTGDPAIRIRLARLCAEGGELREAILEYRTVLARTPQNKTAIRELAELEQRQSRTVQERSAQAAPMTVDDKTPVPVLLRDADAMLANHHYPEAEQAYRFILERNPTTARAFQGVGIAMASQGNAEAFLALDMALKLDPRLQDAQFTLAHLYFDQGFVDEAVRRMLILTHQAPHNATYLHALAACSLDDTSRYLQTEQLLKEAVALAPDRPAYWCDLARTEARLSRSPSAETAYRRALALDPKGVAAMTDFGAFLLDRAPDTARKHEADHLFLIASQLQPGNVDAMLGLGRIALSRGDAKRAVVMLQNAVSGDPNLAQAWYYLARAYDRSGDSQRAEDSRKAFHDITAYRQELSNTEELAHSHLKDPSIRLKLARLYAQGGQNARAINQYQVCISLDKSNVSARKELVELTTRLRAGGRLPSMDVLNRMLIASVRTN